MLLLASIQLVDLFGPKPSLNLPINVKKTHNFNYVDGTFFNGFKTSPNICGDTTRATNLIRMC